jgi:CTP synthase (UTP-ammonia lyase)
MLGVQFHPELISRPLRPHPLFVWFVGACTK